MTEEVIDAESHALAVVESPQQSPAIFSGYPDEVVARAVKVADALKKVVQSKGLVKKIQGREFVEVAGWQTLGAMTGCTAFCEWTRQVEGGWEARVIVRRNGHDVGAAEAQCTRSESTWSRRDDFAIRSMAQTRAQSKALRSVLGFIVVLAGYADTPASEMPEEEQPAPPAPRVVDDNTSENRKKGLAAIHILRDEREISPQAYHELLLTTFPDVYSDPEVAVSAGSLTYKQMRQFYKALKEITEQPA